MSKSKKVKRSNNYDLYISFHPAQKQLVEIFCNQIKDDNLKIWHDHESESEDLIALKTSSLFVYVPSKEYKKCIRNMIEYSIALEQEMKIITLNANEIESSNIKQENKSTDNTSNTSVNSYSSIFKIQVENLIQKFRKLF